MQTSYDSPDASSGVFELRRTMMKSDYLIPYFFRIFKSGFSMDLAQRVYP